MKRALILSGGGARAAYQVGVLKALAEILPADAPCPFPIICGTSAGAINAVWLATHTGSFRAAISDLETIWCQLTPEQIFKSDSWSIFKGIARLGFSLFNEGIGRDKPIALFDNTPLYNLLKRTIPFDNIAPAIQEKRLDAISITAMGYGSGESISFFQGQPELQGWQRHRRNGTPCELTLDHLMASSALPTIFPSVHINREYFGDGAIRQTSPISSALHLGADQIFIIGVSGNRSPKHWGKRVTIKHSPSMAQIMGHMFSSAFIDALEGDIEHLERINKLVEQIPETARAASGLSLKPIESLIISPSEQLDKIAGRKIRNLPKGLRFAMRAVGATARGGGAGIASYLLFTPTFCEALIALGYRDTVWEKEKIQRFFGLPRQF